MTKENPSAGPRVAARKPAVTAVTTPAGPDVAPAGSELAVGFSLDGQLAQLRQLAPAQRQRHLARIGRLQGNQHVQRLVLALQPDTPDASGEPPPAAANGAASPARLAGPRPQIGTAPDASPEGPSRGQNGSSAGGPPQVLFPHNPALIDPAIHPANRTLSPAVAWRQEDEAEGDTPTEAEKKAALAKAAAAEAQAADHKATGKDKIAESREKGAAEKEKKETAKQKVVAAVAAPAAAEAGGGPPGGPAGSEGGAATPGGEGGGPEAAVRGGPDAAGVNGAGARVGVGGGAAVNGSGPGAGPGAEAGGAVGERAPASPEEDPGFQAVTGKVRQAGGRERSHQLAGTEAKKAQDAAESPASELSGQAAGSQVEDMNAAETPGFDAAAFKAKLMERISALAPRTAQEADQFKESGKLAGVKGAVQGEVGAEKDKSKGPLDEAAAAAPDPGSATAKPVAPLAPPEPGAPPGDVGAAAAAPKPKTQGELEAPLQEDARSIDEKMDEAEITETQLANANEPEFQSALDAKQEAQTHAQTAPEGYRQAEASEIQGAEQEAQGASQQQLADMHQDRSQLLNQVQGQQGQTKSADEARRAQVGQDIQAIYEETKTKVETLLNSLDEDVTARFDQGAEEARRVFEDYVDRRMEAYKERRYGGWFGWAKWAKDKLLGMPGEVNAFYTEGRALYLEKMDAVIDDITSLIGARLTEAKAEIAAGRGRIQEYVAQLPQDLQQVGQEAADLIQGKFDELEQAVDDKQNQLIDTLAQKYQEHLQALDARIEELKAANRGLVDKALDAVVGVIRTIMQIKEMLQSVLRQGLEVIKGIIKDPIGFLGNLISGIKQGFLAFVSNIGTHLKKGLMEWLFGAVAEAGIQLPESFDLKGILSLVMQILGLTWANIRARAVKLLGEPVVAALETAFEPFRILITEGVGGLWQWIKDKISNLKEMVLDAIKEMVITQVIQAGIQWLIGILGGPAGAFIKAAKAIYDIVMWFVNNGRRVLSLVQAIIGAISAIVQGNVSAMAQAVEQALARFIPVVISFLASLLGLGDLGAKIRNIIQKVRAPIEKAVDWIIGKARAVATRVGRALGLGRDEQPAVAPEAAAGPESPEVEAGLNDLYAEEARRSGEGGITEEEAGDVAATVKQRHPVFASITPVEGEGSWDYDYVVQRKLAKGRKPKKGGEWDQDLTFEITWPKPVSSAYPKIYLGGRVDSPRSQSAMKAAYSKGNNVGGEPVKEYTPHRGGTLPGGESIGISSDYRIKRGTVVGPLRDVGTPGGRKINNILKRYGFSPDAEGRDGDHVWEIQLGGDDVIENLWPLDSSINKGAGPALNQMNVTHPKSGSVTKISDLKKLSSRNTYKFEITGFSV